MCQIADILWKSIMSVMQYRSYVLTYPIRPNQIFRGIQILFYFPNVWNPFKALTSKENWRKRGKISSFGISSKCIILPKTIIKLIFANFISLFLTLLISGWRLLFVSTTWTLLLWFLLEYLILPATSSGKFHLKRLNI